MQGLETPKEDNQEKSDSRADLTNNTDNFVIFVLNSWCCQHTLHYQLHVLIERAASRDAYQNY